MFVRNIRASPRRNRKERSVRSEDILEGMTSKREMEIVHQVVDANGASSDEQRTPVGEQRRESMRHSRPPSAGTDAVSDQIQQTLSHRLAS